MNRQECVEAYDRELKKQQTPYQQWIISHEMQEQKEEEVEKDQLTVKVCSMEEFTSSFLLSEVKEDILLLKGKEGILAPFAKQRIAATFAKHKDAILVYGDEDEMDVDSGERENPWFKPDYAPDSFLSSFYMGHVVAFRMAFCREIERYDSEDAQISLYDFVLKAVEQKKKVYHIKEVLFHLTQKEEMPLGVEEKFDQIKTEACARRKMQVHLAKMELPVVAMYENDEVASIVRKQQTIRYICYDLKEKPLVSIIIPSKDHSQILIQCIKSLITKTNYKNIEFIIEDNGSSEKEKENIISFLRDTFEQNESRKINCIYDYEEALFHFSDMCNRGAERANGEYLLFLNDDMEIISSEWLERMLGQAMQPHIGAVGAKLWYPDHFRLQHVGITNMGIGPAHKLNGFVDDQIYAHGENCLVLNKMAVTAACLLIKKDRFVKAGMFPSDLAIAYNDVSLCFSLLKAGYSNVVRNDVILLHHESLSRGMDDTAQKKERLAREKNILYTRYPQWEGKDPYYNLNWVQDRKDTDYTCNFIYDYENPNRYSRVTIASELRKALFLKKKSKYKIIRKLFGQDKLIGSIDTVQSKQAMSEQEKQYFYFDKYDDMESEYVEIEGWTAVPGKNNSCYETKFLLKSESGTIYETTVFPKLRYDVEEALLGTETTFCALNGFVVRFPKDRITPGIYEMGYAMKSLQDKRYKFVKWEENLRLSIRSKKTNLYDKID